jgi:1-acyl-sn-glycerol-3-phosphate acyltransferase
MALSHVLFKLLTRVEIIGKERLPKKGPIILAGNHVAELEAVMMAAFTPGQVEFIGNGDIPFDPNYAFFANAYGLIPVNRGNIDRKGLKMGINVLKQGGILGIFPEGGIWDPAQMQAQPGVAWLSYKAKAPILPLGFGGLKGSMGKALKFKHPTLTMTIGELMPPVTIEDETLSLKTNLELAANNIMTKINELIPKEDLEQFLRREDETYDLVIGLQANNIYQPIPKNMQVQHGAAYARFLFNPTVMDVLYRNLQIPIKPLTWVGKFIHPEKVIQAWQSILNYLDINPGYFTYRFGVQRGVAVKQALQELLHLGHWAEDSGYLLKINPIRHYRNSTTGVLVTENGGCFPKSMSEP